MNTRPVDKPLVRKLGLKAGMRVALLNPPLGYDNFLGDLPLEVQSLERLAGPLDFIQFFARTGVELEAAFPRLKESLAPGGILWISWLKGSSRGKGELNENLVREIGLDSGLVDVKVVAIDEAWSALKFVYRLKDRK